MKKILIVDDAADTRLTLRNLLKDEDAEILEATDGLEGWKLIVKEHPDLVLLDINMPTKDGFDILKDLEEEWINVPVVVVSGDDNEDTSKAAIFHGAKAYLKKPIVLKDFKDAIKVLHT